LLGVRQVEASLVDITLEMRLLPQRIAAVDLGDGPDTPWLPRHLLQPLERARLPGIAWCVGLAPLRAQQVPEDQGDARRKDEGTDGGRQVEGVESDVGWVDGDASRHAAQPGDVHRQERDVEADEGQPEGDAAEPFRQQASIDERVEVVAASKDRE